jgi:hypothetical protein
MPHGPDHFDLCGKVLLHMLRGPNALLRIGHGYLRSNRESISAIELLRLWLRLRVHGDEFDRRPTKLLLPSCGAPGAGDCAGDASRNDSAAEQDDEAAKSRIIHLAERNVEVVPFLRRLRFL